MPTERENGDESLLDEVLGQYMLRIDRGESVDREKFIAQHPEVANALRGYFADADALEAMASSWDQEDLQTDQAGAFSGGGGPGDFGDYELLNELGRGGMGVVYRARQRSLNRIVAVKMILAGQLATPEQVNRFRREAEMAANLKHPNIVAIHEVGEEANLHYYSMDYVEGESLSDVVRENPLASRKAAQYIKRVAEAVHHAHEHDTLHRDLKPSNILVDSDDEPHVADFGLARQLEKGAEMTARGAIVGSPSYMAPEQAEGQLERVGPASDIYSLGATLYDLLTGRPPFQADTPSATIVQVITEHPASPRLLNTTVDRDLETVCLKCLEKEPAARYGTAAALADDLGRFLEGKPILARPPGALGRLVRWSKRQPYLAALTAITAVTLVVGTVVSSYFAILSTERADRVERELRKSESLNLAGESRETLERNPGRSLLLAMEAVTKTLQHGESPPARAQETLREAIDFSSDRALRDILQWEKRDGIGRTTHMALSPIDGWLPSAWTTR